MNRPEQNNTESFVEGPSVRGGAVAQHSATAIGRRLAMLLAVTLLIGLPIRLIVAHRAVMVSRDTVTFIWYAQALAENPMAAIRGHDQHPLYPAAVLGAHSIIEHTPLLPASLRCDPVRSWTVAAVGVTMLGGLAVIIAVYLLASTLFDRQTGLLAAVLAAVAAEFCQLSADGLTDMPHLAIYLIAIWAGVRGLQEERFRWFMLAGLLAGANYLLRPEGAEPAVAIAALLIVPQVIRMSWRKRLGAMVCVSVCAMLVASPYMVATGKLVQKKSVWKFLKTPEPVPAFEDAAEASAQSTPALARAGLAGDAPRAIFLVLEKWARSLRGTYLVPLFAWLAWRRRMPCDRTGARLIQAAVGLHVLVLIGLIIRFDYWDLFSMRHVMVLTGMSLPFIAAGIVVIVESVPLERQGWVTVLLAVGLIAPTLPWMFETRYREDAHYRAASQWIYENTPHRPRVMTERFRMAFYARGDYIPAPLVADAPEYLAWARHARPEWLVFDERRILKETPTFFDTLQASTQPGETLVLTRTEKNETAGGRKVRIYRYSYEPRR